MRKISSQEYKEIAKEMLSKIDSICRKNGLKYYLAYGTLLGAVRHKGFIPWDDDVDIIMLPDDYIKLRGILEDNKYGLNFLDPVSCPTTIFPYGKICDTNTIAEEEDNKKVDGYGVFIDVFPLTYTPDSNLMRKWIGFKYYIVIRLIQHSSKTKFQKADSFFVNCLRFAGFLVSRPFHTQKLCKRVQSFFFNLDKKKSNHKSVFAGTIFKSYWFDNTVDLDFEGLKLMAPASFDEILKVSYGDYMKLPPVEERVNKHFITCYLKDSSEIRN